MKSILDLVGAIILNAAGCFLGAMFFLWVTVGITGIRSIRSKFGRPSIRIELKRAPQNIFTGLELGTSAAWVQEQLGHPTKVSDGWWGYRFSDALVSLEFDANKALDTIAVALVFEGGSNFHFPAVHFDCPPLGKIKVSDVQVEHLQMEYVDSTRHAELLYFGSEGPRGAWHYITFGALWPHMPGSLAATEFEWDSDKQALITSAEKVDINWAAVSRKFGAAHFPWDFAFNLLSTQEAKKLSFWRRKSV